MADRDNEDRRRNDDHESDQEEKETYHDAHRRRHDDEDRKPFQFSTSMLVQNIEIFSSGDTRKLANFIQAIEHAALVGHWTNDQKFQVAVMKLKNEALECYNTSGGIRDWVGLISLLKTRFSIMEPRPVLRRKLNSAQQRPGEDPMTFSQRLKSLLMQIDPELQAASEDVRRRVLENLMDRFIDGLRPSLRRNVLAKQPEEWSKAIEIAQLEYQLEEMDKVKSGRIDVLQEEACQYPKNTGAISKTPANTVYPPPQGGQNAGGHNQGPRFSGNNGPTPPRPVPANAARELTCFNCGGRGHIRRNCPTPSGENQDQGRPQFQRPGPPIGHGPPGGPVTRCPVCAGVRWHQVSCPAATPVTQVTPYNPPAQREAPNGTWRSKN